MKVWQTGLLFIMMALFVAKALADEQLIDFIEQQKFELPSAFYFEQKRTIRGLPKPLNSRGKLTIEMDQVRWQIEHPVAQTLLISEEGIVDQSTDQNMQGSEIVARLLLAILQGNVAQLKANFEYEIEGACIRLTPRSQSVGQFIDMIKSCGSPQLDTITLIESKDNKSVISLTAVSDAKRELD